MRVELRAFGEFLAVVGLTAEAAAYRALADAPAASPEQYSLIGRAGIAELDKRFDG